jgi:hypothetical protein
VGVGHIIGRHQYQRLDDLNAMKTRLAKMIDERARQIEAAK